MIKNLDKDGLSLVFDKYDLFFIDLWGVVHDGIKLNEEAVNVLFKLLELKKEFVLLTNAPRPNKTVEDFLQKMGLDKKIRQKVFTSGQAALNFLKKTHAKDLFYHIGPPRDFDLFLDFKKNKTEDINESNYFLCTGLYNEQNKDLDYYKKLLINFTSKEMICTNPDLVVDRGEEREYCAGSVAMIFENLGGKVIYFGKPYAQVYNESTDIKKKNIIAIGDNLRTDIKGAIDMNYDSLFITQGIHKNEIQKEGLESVLKKYKVKSTYHQLKLKW